MSTMQVSEEKRSELRPGTAIKSEPWSFILLALGVGALAGVVLRFAGFGRSYRVYRLVRRFV